jgi:hypothetical protein
MPESIKAQIIKRVLSNLGAMVDNANPTAKGKVRQVSREMDLLKWGSFLPAIMVYDGDEEFSEEDNRGVTVRFPLAVKIIWEDQRSLARLKDELVPEVQRIMESDIQLGGLANWVKGGEEQPFIAEIGKPQGGSFVYYEVEYRRKRGNPYETY